MATNKQYPRLRAGPGQSFRRERHVNPEEYEAFYNLHEADLAEELRRLGYKVTKQGEKALARISVNAYHNYPRAPSQWNQYVAQNMRRVMDENNVQAKDAMVILGAEWRRLHAAPVAAGISGGARRPRRRRPALRM